MVTKKIEKKEFEVTAKSSSLSEEEKKELLYQCFDILFTSDPDNKKKAKKN
jgi:hypothetical protein